MKNAEESIIDFLDNYTPHIPPGFGGPQRNATAIARKTQTLPGRGGQMFTAMMQTLRYVPFATVQERMHLAFQRFLTEVQGAISFVVEHTPRELFVLSMIWRQVLSIPQLQLITAESPGYTGELLDMRPHARNLLITDFYYQGCDTDIELHDALELLAEEDTSQPRSVYVVAPMVERAIARERLQEAQDLNVELKFYATHSFLTGRQLPALTTIYQGLVPTPAIESELDTPLIYTDYIISYSDLFQIANTSIFEQPRFDPNVLQQQYGF